MSATNGQTPAEAGPPPPSAGEADGRKTIRGIAPEAWAKLVKAADAADVSHGAWASAAFHEKFERDRKAGGLPAVIAAETAPVTALMPTLVSPLVHVEAAHPLNQHIGQHIVDEHLKVIEALAALAADFQSALVRDAADKIMLERLKLLRVRKPGQTKPRQSLPQGADAADNRASAG